MQYIIDAYTQATKRLLLFDYDGTLVPFTPTPAEAAPSPKILKILQKLATDPRNHIVIVSGRDYLTLQAWLGDLPLGLSAEHGFWVRPIGEKWQAVTAKVNMAWQKEAKLLTKTACDVLPGSFIEEKHASLAWHYRASDERYALQAAQQLLCRLQALKAKYPCVVLDGNKVIEIKPSSFDKGSAAQHWLSQPFDYILAVGDDVTDEHLFAALPEHAFSIKIGDGQSIAKERLMQRDFSSLLEVLATS